MKAILLAAGRGRPEGLPEPKCLHDVRGRSLLQRHLEALDAVGIERLVLVTGHGAGQLRAAVQLVVDARRAMRRPLRFPIEPVFNEDFTRGSLLSLHRAFDRLADEGGLWLESDLLYPPRLLKRLIESPHGNALLLDSRLRDVGRPSEPRRHVTVREGRVRRVALADELDDDADLVGAFVGMAKVDAKGAAVMSRILGERVDAGDLDAPHEDAIDAALDELTMGYAKVDDLPWTDLDVPDDLAKAAQLAIPIDRPER